MEPKLNVNVTSLVDNRTASFSENAEITVKVKEMGNKKSSTTQDKTNLQGRTVFVFREKMEGVERFQKGANMLALTIISLGIALFSRDVRKEWKSVIKGESKYAVKIVSDYVDEETKKKVQASVEDVKNVLKSYYTNKMNQERDVVMQQVKQGAESIKISREYSQVAGSQTKGYKLDFITLADGQTQAILTKLPTRKQEVVKDGQKKYGDHTVVIKDGKLGTVGTPSQDSSQMSSSIKHEYPFGHDLDRIENDGNPVKVDILENMTKIKKGELVLGSTTPIVLPKDGKEPFEGTMPVLRNDLVVGQMDSAHGISQAGDQKLTVAVVTCAVDPTEQPAYVSKKKPIEDRSVLIQQTFNVNGLQVPTTLALSCDGNAGAQAAEFYAVEFPKIFQKVLQKNLSSSSQIDSAVVLGAMQKSFEKLKDQYDTKARIENKELTERVSDSTFNGVFLFPQENRKVSGVCLNYGDSRSIVIRNNGFIERAHPIGENENEKDEKSGFFTLEQGDSILLSSDGLWHTGSALQIGEIVHNRFNELKGNKTGSDLAAIQELVLTELVCASACGGRPDDRNPMLIHLPATPVSDA